MKELLITVLLCVGYSQALECGVGRVNKDELQQALTLCVKNNETLEKIMDMANSMLSSSEDSKLESSEEKTHKGHIEKDTKLLKMGRIKRSRYSKLNDNHRQPSGGRKDADKSKHESEENEENTTTENNTSKPEGDLSNNCITHCVFEHFGLLDDEGFPKHNKFVDGLLETATGRELRDFLQDSADECFQQMDHEDNKEPCSYSMKLASCVAEKAKSNCSDWPAGFPF